jgi:hypothetical protein
MVRMALGSACKCRLILPRGKRHDHSLRRRLRTQARFPTRVANLFSDLRRANPIDRRISRTPITWPTLPASRPLPMAAIPFSRLCPSNRVQGGPPGLG